MLLHSAKAVSDKVIGVVLNKVDFKSLGASTENVDITTKTSSTHDTATSNDFAYRQSLRASAMLVGLIGIAWGVFEFPALRQESTIKKIADRILAGDVYKYDILLKQSSLVESTQKPELCRPLTVRSAAVIRLRLAEISDNAALGPAPVRNNLAVDAIRQSLACSPADPFFWLALYALEPSAPLNYLAASYRLGPNEGWIALKRNPVAFANFDELPDDLRPIVVQEFVRIVEMDAIDDAMKIFVGPAWDKRNLILSQMDQVPLRQRQRFQAVLTGAGYDVLVPGTRSDEPLSVFQRRLNTSLQPGRPTSNPGFDCASLPLSERWVGCRRKHTDRSVVECASPAIAMRSDIPFIEIILLFARYLFAAVDLCPAGNTRADHQANCWIGGLVLW